MMTLSLARADLICGQSFLNGRWIDAADGRVFPVTDPATGELIVNVPDCTPRDAAAAVDAAHYGLDEYMNIKYIRPGSLRRIAS